MSDFFEMLDRVPRLACLWDKKKKELRQDKFEAALGVMSSGEVHMAKFFASVWFGDNKRYGFDFVDAVAYIELSHRRLIRGWMDSPFYP